MEYIIMRYKVYYEFKKLSNGEFYYNSPSDRNRAHYLAELKDIFKQCQFQGIIFGICLGIFSGQKLNMTHRIFIALVSREVFSLYYISDIYNRLDLQ